MCPPVLLLGLGCLRELGMLVLGWRGWAGQALLVWCLPGPFLLQSRLQPVRLSWLWLLSFPCLWSQLSDTVKAAGSACPPIHHGPLAAPAPLSPSVPSVPHRDLAPPQTPDVFLICCGTFYNIHVERFYLTAKRITELLTFYTFMFISYNSNVIFFKIFF